MMKKSIQDNLSDAEFNYRRGNIAEAIACYKAAYNKDKKNLIITLTLANLLFQTLRLDEADHILRNCRRTHAKNAKVFILSGLVAHKGGRCSEAVTFFQNALDLLQTYSGPDCRDLTRVALLNKAVSLRYCGQADAAIEIYLQLKSDYGVSKELMLNLGNALNAKQEFLSAFDVYEDGLRAYPEDTDLLQGLAEAKYNSGRLEEAKSIYFQALAINPTSASHRFGLSLIQLAQDQFEEGWKNYEYRWQDPFFLEQCYTTMKDFLPFFKSPKSLGDLEKKSVAVISEQGPGDTLMFSTMINDLQNCGAHILFIVEARLIKLVQTIYPKIECEQKEYYSVNKLHAYDYVIPVGSLGQFFGNKYEDFEKRSKNIPEEFKNSTTRIKNQEFRVGISWRGGTASTRQNHRSFNLDQLKPILSIQNISFVSLQFNEAEEEFKNLGMPIERLTHEQKQNINTLAEIIKDLDLIITVQNTNVHICGITRRKCLVLLPSFPEWRYRLDGSKMLWYESVELLRNSEETSWSKSIEIAKLRLIEESNKFYSNYDH